MPWFRFSAFLRLSFDLPYACFTSYIGRGYHKVNELLSPPNGHLGTVLTGLKLTTQKLCFISSNLVRNVLESIKAKPSMFLCDR